MNTLPSYLSFESNLDLEADYLIPYTIKAEIGKVESGLIALEDISREGYITDDNIAEMFYINQEDYTSQEGLGTVFHTIVEAIKKAIEKIKDWFKSMWAKINIFLINVFKYIDKVADEFRYLRNKDQLSFGPTVINQFYKLFPTADINNPITAIEGSLNCLSNFEKVAADIIRNGHQFKPGDKYVIYDNGAEITYFSKPDTKDNKLVLVPKVSKAEITVGYKPKPEATQGMTTSFDVWLNFAKALDKARYDINRIVATIEKISKSTEATANLLEKSPTTRADSKDALQNILTLQSKGVMTVTFNYIDIIKKATKFLKLVLKNAEDGGMAGYLKFINAYNSPNSKLKEEISKVLLVPGSEPNTMEQMVFNKLSIGSKGEMLWVEVDASPSFARMGGACALPNLKYDVNGSDVATAASLDAMNKQIEEASKGVEGVKDVRNLNIVFISSPIVNKLIADTPLKGKGFDFIYWHEVGHIVTNQQEMVYVAAKDKDLFDPIGRYVRHRTENQADAFAILKTGVSIEQVWEFRKAFFIGITEEIKNDIIKEKGEEEFNKLLKQVGDDIDRQFKKEFITNITREMQVMRKYVKLGFRGWLRSVLTK